MDLAQLQLLLLHPSEQMHVEHKGWQVSSNDKRSSAKIAKELMALANHGGGYLVVGFASESGNLASVPAQSDGQVQFWTTDRVNQIVAKYADPRFHCDVRLLTHPVTGVVHPIIEVHGSSTPVRCRRSDPSGVVADNAYYVRRAGAESGPPETAAQWDVLIGRCIREQREELFESFRTIVMGHIEDTPAAASVADRLTEWGNSIGDLTFMQLMDPFEISHSSAWSELASVFLEESDSIELQEVKKDIERAGARAYSARPPFVVRSGSAAPFALENAVHAANVTRDPGSVDIRSEVWSAGPAGQLQIVQTFAEDALSDDGVTPFTRLDPLMTMHKLGEYLLFLEQYAEVRDRSEVEALVPLQYFGLEGRQLEFLPFGKHRQRWKQAAVQNDFKKQLVVQVGTIRETLPEILYSFLNDLFALFGLARVPMAEYVRVAEKLLTQPG